MPLTPIQIKEIRLKLGRTQQGMAVIVGTTGVTWSRWELGNATPLPVFAEKLEKLYEFAMRPKDENWRGEK